MYKTLGNKSKFTIEDYPDRKYNIGQKVYILDYKDLSHGIYPYESITIKEYTIKDMTSGSLYRKVFKNPKPLEFGYAYNVNEDSFEIIFEKLSYGSLEEALKALDKTIEDCYTEYKQKAMDYNQTVERKYKEWKKYSSDLKETINGE